MPIHDKSVLLTPWFVQDVRAYANGHCMVVDEHYVLCDGELFF